MTGSRQTQILYSDTQNPMVENATLATLIAGRSGIAGDKDGLRLLNRLVFVPALDTSPTLVERSV